MPPPPEICLGPLTRTISNGAKWWSEDKFPAWQEWADEVERVLEHLLAQGQFDRFLHRLSDVDAKHRDAKLAEARTSFFFFRNGFRIMEYDPPGADGNEGDLTVQWRTTAPIFVEVKNPNWRGELLPRTKADQKCLTKGQWRWFKDRLRQPKDIDGEARWIDPVGQAIWVIEENALKKLHGDRPNLVVVSDDFFVTLIDIPNLVPVIEARMQNSLYERLGGILFLKPDLRDTEVSYRMDFVENKRALQPCRLPYEVATGFSTSAHERRAKKIGWA